MQRECGLEVENDDLEDENFFHDDRLVVHVAQGRLEDQLVCVVELKEEIFERVCIIDWDSRQEIDAHQMFMQILRVCFWDI